MHGRVEELCHYRDVRLNKMVRMRKNCPGELVFSYASLDLAMLRVLYAYLGPVLDPEKYPRGVRRGGDIGRRQRLRIWTR